MSAMTPHNGISVKIAEADLDHPRIVELLQIHLICARANTPRDSIHALERSGLEAPEVDFWAAWDGEQLLGFAALKQISPDHGEVKSMHVAAAWRRRGVGSCLLQHVTEAAHARGMCRLSLETGAADASHPARMLYRRHGFSECAPFGDYRPDPHSIFMSRVLKTMAEDNG